MTEHLKLVQMSRTPPAGLFLMSQCSTYNLSFSLRTYTKVHLTARRCGSLRSLYGTSRPRVRKQASGLLC